MPAEVGVPLIALMCPGDKGAMMVNVGQQPFKLQPPVSWQWICGPIFLGVIFLQQLMSPKNGLRGRLVWEETFTDPLNQRVVHWSSMRPKLSIPWLNSWSCDANGEFLWLEIFMSDGGVRLVGVGGCWLVDFCANAKVTLPDNVETWPVYVTWLKKKTHISQLSMSTISMLSWCSKRERSLFQTSKHYENGPGFLWNYSNPIQWTSAIRNQRKC